MSTEMALQSETSESSPSHGRALTYGWQIAVGLALGFALAELLKALHHWWAVDTNRLSGNVRWIVTFTLLGAVLGMLVLAARRWPLVLVTAGFGLLALHAGPFVGIGRSWLIGLTVSPATVLVGGALVGGGVAAAVVNRRRL